MWLIAPSTFFLSAPAAGGSISESSWHFPALFAHIVRGERWLYITEGDEQMQEADMHHDDHRWLGWEGGAD